MNDITLSILISIGPFVALLVIGFIFGTVAQRNHMADLDQREAELGDVMLTTLPHVDGRHGELVTGSTVVAYDFFRRIAVTLRKLIGGRFRMHEDMMMRARREALLRMAEDAQGRGAMAVHNIRLISSNLGDSGAAMGGCEVLAYGTAIWA